MLSFENLENLKKIDKSYRVDQMSRGRSKLTLVYYAYVAVNTRNQI